METDSKEIIGLDEGLNNVVFSILRGVLDTVTVGIVESYDASKQIVTVQPALKRLRENETEAQPRAVLADVRVVFMGSGDYWLTFPISKGDPILLLTPSRSLDVWLNKGGIVDPGSNRIFDLSDAIALPGMLDDNQTIPNLKNDGLYLRRKDESTYLKLHGGGVDVKGDLDVTGNVDITGNLDVGGSAEVGGSVDVSGSITAVSTIKSTGGDIMAGLTSLKLHIHTANTTVSNAVPAGPGPVTGTGTTTPPLV